MTKWKKQSNEFVEKHLKGKILDVGAGLHHQHNATTLDIRNDADVDIVADIIKGIPLPDESFDTVVLNNVLEHLHDPAKAIAECHRVLKKEGRIIAVVPFFIKIHQEPMDFHRYTIYMLEKLFADFDTEIQPIGNLSDIYRDVSSNMFGLIKKKTPIKWTVSRLIKLTLPLFRDIEYEDYPYGYTILAIK